MSNDFAIALSSEMLWTALLICLPILGLSMAVGLVISVFQVVTQIQEMSLTFVPKIITVALCLIILGSWMLDVLTNYASGLFKSIPMML